MNDSTQILQSPLNAPPRAKGWFLPAWWKDMYSRNAKGIDPSLWEDLMKPADWKEILGIILSNDPHKAAGIDGVGGTWLNYLLRTRLMNPLVC